MYFFRISKLRDFLSGGETATATATTRTTKTPSLLPCETKHTAVIRLDTLPPSGQKKILHPVSGTRERFRTCENKTALKQHLLRNCSVMNEYLMYISDWV